jgi:hypothetical protein
MLYHAGIHKTTSGNLIWILHKTTTSRWAGITSFGFDAVKTSSITRYAKNNARMPPAGLLLLFLAHFFLSCKHYYSSLYTLCSFAAGFIKTVPFQGKNKQWSSPIREEVRLDDARLDGASSR